MSEEHVRRRLAAILAADVVGYLDRSIGIPTLEDGMDDVRAVMDTVGSEQAVLFGVSAGGNMSALFAAAYPNRTTALGQ